jgi:hypothetical protein
LSLASPWRGGVGGSPRIGASSRRCRTTPPARSCGLCWRGPGGWDLNLGARPAGANKNVLTALQTSSDGITSVRDTGTDLHREKKTHLEHSFGQILVPLQIEGESVGTIDCGRPFVALNLQKNCFVVSALPCPDLPRFTQYI